VAAKASGTNELAVEFKDAVKPQRVVPPSNANACPIPFPSSTIKPASSGFVEPEFNNINLSSTAKLATFK
jgi:hypothetical protein